MRYVGASGRGGISVAEYMGRCLRDEQFGYYTNPPSYDDEDEEFGDEDEDDEGDANDDVEGYEIDDNDDWDTIDDDTKNTDEKMFKKTAGEDETTSVEPPPLAEGRGHRIIGAAGDFTTAPEISQIFGECLTVWLLAQYETMGKPSKVQLVEIGPGRGTLICDVLRSARGIKGAGEDFVAALAAGDGDGGSTNMVSGLHLVEVSENLRAGQFEALEALELQMTKNNKRQSHNNNSRADDDDDDSADIDDIISNRKSSSGLSFNLFKWKTKEEEQEEMEALVQKVRKRMDDQDEHDVDPTLFSEIMADKKQKQGVEIGGNANEQGSIPVQWHSTFNSIPSSIAIPTFIIGQEILDALPVHIFQKTEDGWRERLIDVAIREDCDDDDNNNATPQPPSSTVVTGASTESNITTTKKPRFRYVLSPGTTPALRALLHVDDEEHHTTSTNTGTNNTTLDSAPVGTVIEVCPEAMLLAQDITSRIKACNGAALLIDYGNEGSGDTLRAFRRHEQVDVLSRPGTVDITADVDFAALRDAVNVGMAKEGRNNRNMDKDSVASSSSSGVGIVKDDEKNNPIAFGPVSQGQFLASMGAVERTVNLIEDENTTDEQAEELCTALERLVSEEEMGQRYKVMAIARKKSGIFPPPGF